jgi:hypothetical protein
MRKLPTLVALSLLGAATAFAEHPPLSRSSDTTSLVVQNNRTAPVRVYLDIGNEEISLGSVKPLDVATLVVPRWLVRNDEEVNIFVEPQRGFEMQTGYIDLQPGEHVGIIVPDRNIGFPKFLTPDR